MHQIQDENGNLCAHTHEHEHTHTHSHEHSHAHSHGHGDGHEHTHSHGAKAGCEKGCEGCTGHEEGQEVPEEERMAALLDYMLQHNEHHAAELDQVADKFRAGGKEQAAEQIKKAVDEFQKGNLYLKLALSMVREQ